MRVSARTGEGLDALRAALLRAGARSGAARRPWAWLRLPIDRVFTLKGFGTVVTGTLVAGEPRRGRRGRDPAGRPAGARARAAGPRRGASRAVAGRHAHGGQPGRRGGGRRCARRRARPSRNAGRHARCSTSSSSCCPRRGRSQDGARVRVHVASAEVLARVRLLEPGPLAPGRAALAQLRLESSGRGGPRRPARDPLLLAGRRRSAARGCSTRCRRGGGPGTGRRGAPACRGHARRGRRTRSRPRPAPRGSRPPALAARLTLPLQRSAPPWPRAPALVALGHEPAVVFAASALAALGDATLAGARGVSTAAPLRAAMPREELRERVFRRAPAAALRARAGRSRRGGSRPAGARAVALPGPRGAPEPRRGGGAPAC